MKSAHLLFGLFLLPFLSFSQLEDATLDSLKKIRKAELKAEMVEMHIGVYILQNPFLQKKPWIIIRVAAPSKP